MAGNGSRYSTFSEANAGTTYACLRVYSVPGGNPAGTTWFDTHAYYCGQRYASCRSYGRSRMMASPAASIEGP